MPARSTGVATRTDRSASGDGAHWASVLIVSLFVVFIVFPKTLAQAAAPEADIAAGAPTISTYGVAVLGLTAGGLLTYPSWRRLPHGPPGMLAFPCFAGLALALVWGPSPERLSGYIQLLMGAAALAIGSTLARSALTTSRDQSLVARAVLAIVVIEVVASVAQRLGLDLNPMKPDLAALMGDRVNGTLNHPNNLGKSMLVLIVVCLGLSSSDARSVRRCAAGATGLAFVPLLLSGGRANLAAAVLTIFFWSLLSTGRRPALVRLGLPVLLVIVILPFAGGIVERFEADPEGGPRRELNATAIAQIGMRPLWGTGPNAYVSVVQDFDPVVAAGYPVHNTFFLTAAEFGIPGAVLYWLPIAALLVTLWRGRRRPGIPGAMAIAVIASLPGLYFVTTTGWAMLSGSMLPLWSLVFGLAYGLNRAGKSPVRARGASVVAVPAVRPSTARPQ